MFNRKLPLLWLACIAAALLGAPALAQDPGSEEFVEEVLAEEAADGEVLAEDVYGDETSEEVVEAEAMEEESLEEPPPAPPVRPVSRAVPGVRPRSSAPIVARPQPRMGVRPPTPRAVKPNRPASIPALIPPNGLKSGENGESEEKNGATPDEPVAFDFDQQELFEVIRRISALTGRNFDVDPNIAATTVTIITHDKIPPELAYEVLESILATRGFSMVETLDGHLIKVISTPDVTTSEKTPLVKGTEPIVEGFDAYATHIVPVLHADAAELSSALKILGSKSARIDTYVPTNTLIITDTADGLRRIFTFLDDVDIPGNETEIEIYTLEYTRAEVISQQLDQVLNETGAPGSGTAARRPQPTRPTTTRTVRPVPGAMASQVIGSREETLRMVPDERLNALIVVATEGMMERVRDLVKRLDMPTPYESNNLHIYELLNADAEQVEQAIQPLIGTAPRRAGGGGGAAGGGGGGAAGQAEVQPFEQKVQIARYDQTNSLLIVASPQDYQLLEAFIARLDVPQRQVLVDVVVMDVTISNDYGVVVDAAGITGNDGFGLTSTANLAALAAGLQSTADAANATVGGPAASLALGVLGLGTEGGLSAGVFDDMDVNINGVDVKIPFVPILFQAIEQVTDLEVLSQPSLTTVDNEEASIVVGQEVPFITSTSSPRGSNANTDGTANQSYYGGYTRIQREEVGVKMTVTPQISEGDNVLLEIEVEVSDTDAAQIGTIDIVGPTTNKTLINNKVLVKDGATAVLAGLIRDNTSRKRKQPPILGDLPVLGWLFRSKTSVFEKRNLVVLVTPHIVKESIDLERVTHHKVTEYHDANVEELMNQGFFKKVKLKSKIRKKHRPTFDKSQSLTGSRAGSKFGRGDIKR